jgi:hypothetical protein
MKLISLSIYFPSITHIAIYSAQYHLNKYLFGEFLISILRLKQLKSDLYSLK